MATPVKFSTLCKLASLNLSYSSRIKFIISSPLKLAFSFKILALTSSKICLASIVTKLVSSPENASFFMILSTCGIFLKSFNLRS